MSLATRCIHCHTTFKVVQDQLKVSQGWVKCGQCHQAFNALEAMFDTAQLSVWSESMLSSEETLPTTPKAVTAPEPAQAPAPDAAPGPAPAFSSIEPQTPEVIWSHLLATPAPDAIERSLPPPSQRRGRPGTRGRATASPATGFIKQAEKQAIWRHPVVRSLLALMALVLTAVLGLQMAHHWRNTLAATWPATQPWLKIWCEVAACTLSAPMDINALSVDSISVVKVESLGADAYQLTVIIQNNSQASVQWPLLDLTLTNSNGEVLTRRSLRVNTAHQVPVTDDHTQAASQHLPVSPTATPGMTALQWQLRAPDLQLASYTAELFYP
jgi:predicted Zn finger-like uncharacterized protein